MSSFTDLKMLNDLSPAEITDLTERCYNDCSEVDGHLLYKGEDRPTYPQITFTLRARRFQMRKYQLSLFLKLKEAADFDMATWTPEMSSSHLCHKKGCVKQEHLVLETYERNRERERRLQAKRAVWRSSGLTTLHHLTVQVFVIALFIVFQVT